MSNTNMPPEVKDVFEALFQEVAKVHLKWMVIEQLYGVRENVDLMNETASLTFRLFQDSLMDDVLLSIGRLTDPASTGNKTNLSLMTLVDKVSDDVFKAELVRRIANADTYFDKVRDRRNREIAHTDLRTYLKCHPTPLPAVTREEVNFALGAIAEVMDAVEGYYNNGELSFDVITPEDWRQLISRLRLAQKARAEGLDRQWRSEIYK